MKNLKKYLLPLFIIVLTIIVVNVIFSHPPKSQRGKPANKAITGVNIQTLEPQSYQILIDSFGTVKPRTQSVLTAQVTGQISHIAENFRDGGFFNKGDVLVEIDDRDYIAELKISQAGVLTAKQQLLEEQAKVKQAKADWQRLGNGKQASALVLRQPQLAAVQAQLLSAQARLDKAELALSRTKIVAPYQGRILAKKVDIGQVVSMNSSLANIYASDYVEIRLPISNSDVKYTLFPKAGLAESQAKVQFAGQLNNQKWLGFLSRTESSIDPKSQQLYVVAQIDAPFTEGEEHKNTADITLKIGQYLEAKIAGKTIDNALVIPNSAIYQGSYVYIEQDNLLKRKNISIAWQNNHEALIKSGLTFGDHLVLTSLGQVSSGTAVKVIDTSSAQKNKPSRTDSRSEKSS